MISVIIPTFNEREGIRACIEHVLSERGDTEVIVCDGGSTDGTPDVVREYGDKGVLLVKTQKGRGTQMNAGAAEAGGDILLFLHADTSLERGWYDAVTRALGDTKRSGGAFSLRIDSPRRQFRMIESLVNLRCRICKLPYGDQAIFMRRRTFIDVGGYRDIPLMEDVDMVERLKAAGTIVMLAQQAVTAARRWEREGWLYTSARNQLIMLLYRMGADPRRLARMYSR
jgi:rSAM/selenodomain-associated transferase 2